MQTATLSRQSVPQAPVSQTVAPHSSEKSQKVAASRQIDHVPLIGRAPRAGHAPLRLTRRGRVVFTGLAAVLVTAVMVGLGIGTGTAQATNSAPSHSGTGRYLARVTVRPGESLWAVAENTAPGADPRAIIAEVIDLNRLGGTTVYPGEQLWVPRQ